MERAPPKRQQNLLAALFREVANTVTAIIYNEPTPAQLRAQDREREHLRRTYIADQAERWRAVERSVSEGNSRIRRWEDAGYSCGRAPPGYYREGIHRPEDALSSWFRDADVMASFVGVEEINRQRAEYRKGDAARDRLRAALTEEKQRYKAVCRAVQESHTPSSFSATLEQLGYRLTPARPA